MSQADPLAHPLIAVHGRTLRALDRRTGRLLWEYESRLAIARIALANGRVFALDDECKVHCIDAAGGAVLGVVSIDRVESSACALVADGDALYVATTKSVLALDGRGQILWRAEAGGAFAARAGLAIPGDVVQPDFTGN